MSFEGKKSKFAENVKNSPLARPPAAVWRNTALAGLALAIVFTAWPQLDLYVSGLFYRVTTPHFIFVDTPAGTSSRTFFIDIFILFSVLSLVGLAAAVFARRRLFGFGIRHWLYIVLCLVIGPGLVTNALLKDHWGRARPVQVEQFGGTASFTPALLPSHNCDRNCSFVGGESSSIFMMFYSLALLLARWRGRLLVVGTLMGLAAGLVRIGMGGHFLSDILFSGVFMLLTASLLHWLVFVVAQPRE